MSEVCGLVAVSIRTAVSADADGIARVFLESAEHHAGLDPERYSVPSVEIVAARYRMGRQHPHGVDAITLVAECDGEIVGFVDARLERSRDPMHRDLVYCHVAELAVGRRYQSRGIGGQLLEAAEAWGHQNGATLASLEYHAANTRAGRFYQRRMGYSVAATILIKPLTSFR
jgi:GNAT superfamily N-acetyltransferase